VIFVAIKKVGRQIPPPPLFFVAAVGSGILDLGSEIPDPGWIKIRIRAKHAGSGTLNLGNIKTAYCAKISSYVNLNLQFNVTICTKHKKEF
jgi:hypothetical protein